MLFGASFYDFNHHQKYILLSFEYGGIYFRYNYNEKRGLSMG